MDLKLIPVNEGKEKQLREELQKYKMFNSVEQFIEMFNEGILSSGNDLVDKYAEMIESTYKNLSLLKKGSKSRFIIKTPTEISCQNALFMLKGWETLTTLKRIANILFEENYAEDTKIVFSSSMQGVPQVELVLSETEVKLEPHWASEKMVTKNEHLMDNFIIKSYLKPYNDEKDSYYIDMTELIDLDDDFIVEIEDIILKNTLLDIGEEPTQEIEPDEEVLEEE